MLKPCKISLIIIIGAWMIISGGSHFAANPITNWTRDDLLTAKTEWKRLGFKFDFSELNLTNSTLEQIQAAAAITNLGVNTGWRSQTLVSRDLTPMEPVSQTHSLLISRQDYLMDHRGEDLWALLRKEFSAIDQEMNLARAAALKTALRFDLKPNAAGDILLPHLSAVKNTAQAFSKSALLNFHDGKNKEAWHDLEAVSTLAARWQVEPIEISYLVRGAIVKIAYGTLWELLSKPGWSEKELARLQELFESMDLLSNFPSTCAFQRATLSAQINAMRQPDRSPPSIFDQAKTVTTNPRQAFDNVKSTFEERSRHRHWVEKWSWIEESQLLSNSIGKEIALKEALKKLSWQEMKPIWVPASTNEISPNPAFRLTPRLNVQRIMIASAVYRERAQAGTFGSVLNAEAHRRIMITAIAIERYRLQYQSLPSELNQLMPRFLKTLPLDPIDAKPLRYLPEASGEFILYSIGFDEQDNGGKQLVQQSPSEYPRKAIPFDLIWPKWTHQPAPRPSRFSPPGDLEPPE